VGVVVDFDAGVQDRRCPCHGNRTRLVPDTVPDDAAVGLAICTASGSARPRRFFQTPNEAYYCVEG
jgi:hypothetical protein